MSQSLRKEGPPLNQAPSYRSRLGWQSILRIEGLTDIFQMSFSFQENDKVLMNMYSVHKFFLEIIDEMEERLTSQLQKNYLLNWSPTTALTFINAVKYYLNQQPDLFQQGLKKFTQKEIKYFVQHEQRSKKTRSGQVKMERTSTVKTKSAKDEVPSRLPENMEIKKEEDEDFDDIKDFPLFDKAVKQAQQSYKKQEISQLQRQSVKSEAQNVFRPVLSQIYEDSPVEDEDPEDLDNSDFYERAYKKGNAVVFGNFTSRGLRRKPKQDDRIYVQLTNCFIKMAANGRDAFYDKMYLQLFKMDKSDVRL